MVPLAGIEPALLAELDFESSASTNSATGASGMGLRLAATMPDYTVPAGHVNHIQTMTCFAALPAWRRTLTRKKDAGMGPVPNCQG